MNKKKEKIEKIGYRTEGTFLGYPISAWWTDGEREVKTTDSFKTVELIVNKINQIIERLEE